MKKVACRAALAGALLASSTPLALLLAGCPNPISAVVLDEMTDEISPLVTINSPVDGAPYSQTVTVQGTATDNGKVRGVSYLVAGTLGDLFGGRVSAEELGAGGAFQFQFSTISFSGPIVVSVVADDWNDNRAADSVTLQYPGSAVSSFAAVPGNKQVQLSWEAVPDATAYTVYYTDNGTLPTETYGRSIAAAGTAHLLTGLRNGAPHTFLLKAALASGGAHYSSYVSVIPLSQMTLAPVVTGGYREIRLEWAEIAATNQFEVLRSTGASGPFVNYTGVVTGNSFVDTGVADDQWYWYKVRPAQGGSIESHANAAQTFQVPTTQSRLSSLNTLYDADRVRVAGSHAYVAAGAGGLMVIDISDPRAPRYVTRLATTNARDLTINGTTLYLADGTAGLRIIDITNPASPRIDKTLGGLGDAAELSLVAGYKRLFVLDSSGATRVLSVDVDLAQPANPSVTSQYSNASYEMLDVEAVYYSNYFLIYLGTTPSGGGCLLQLYQSTASGGALTFYRALVGPDYTPARLAVGGGYVYTLAQANAYLEPPPPYEVMIFNNASTFSVPTVVGEYAGPLQGSVADIRVVGGRAYAVDSIGMHVFDVSTPSAPQPIDELNTPGAPTGIDSDGSYAFVASGVKLFQTVDLSLPNGAQVVGSYDQGGTYGVQSAVARGAYLYAAVGGATPGLQVLNVSNPLSPSPEGGVGVPGAAALALSGPFAFVAAGGNGLQVVDIEAPGAPAIVGSAPVVSGFVRRVAVKGDYAYLAGSTGLQIYDVADPTRPSWVGFLDADGVGGIQDVTVRGRYVYAVEGAYFQPNNLKIIDAANPASPVVVDRIDTGLTLHRVSLYGDYAFAADDFPDNGVWAININPSSGAYKAVYGPCDTAPGSTEGSTKGIVAIGQYAYVGDSNSGFGLIDISDPAKLSDAQLVDTLDWAGSNPEDVILSGRYAYVADASEGLRVIRLFQ